MEKLPSVPPDKGPIIYHLSKNNSSGLLRKTLKNPKTKKQSDLRGIRVISPTNTTQRLMCTPSSRFMMVSGFADFISEVNFSPLAVATKTLNPE